MRACVHACVLRTNPHRVSPERAPCALAEGGSRGGASRHSPLMTVAPASFLVSAAGKLWINLPAQTTLVFKQVYENPGDEVPEEEEREGEEAPAAEQQEAEKESSSPSP